MKSKTYIKKELEIAMVIAMEWGYKSCERGDNIQLAMEKFIKLLTTKEIC